LPENWEALQVFLACQTQWRYAGMTGVRTGLDYTALDVVMRIRQTQDLQDALWRIQEIERAALNALREQAE